MDEKKIRSRLSEGYIHIRAIVEVAGTPKDYVEESLKGFVAKIEKDSNHVMIKKDINEAKEQDGIFICFVDLDMLVKDSMALLSFCFDYMPSSVEIVEPGKLVYDSFEFNGFLNDMQARLHAVNMGINDFKEKNLNLIRNTTTLMKNFTLYALGEPKGAEELAKATGIKKEEMQKLLDAMVKDKVVIKKGAKYSRK